MALKDEFELSLKMAEAIQRKMEKELLAKYRQTNTELKAMFADLFKKYEIDGKLTYVEMQRYNRLRAVKDEIAKTMDELYLKERTILNAELKAMFESGYYHTAYAIEKEVQAKLSYTILDVNKIKKAIQNPISGLTLNETLSKNRVNIIGKINQEITQGLMRGESFGKMAKRITDTLGGDASKAVKVAQTEGHRVHNAASYESVKEADELGVEMVKVWVSTLDNRTRDAHQDLDGERIGVNDNFKSSAGGRGPVPGQMGNAADDINCRCTYVVEVEGVSHDFRRVRGDGVIPYTTYNEWAEAKGIK